MKAFVLLASLGLALTALAAEPVPELYLGAGTVGLAESWSSHPGNLYVYFPNVVVRERGSGRPWSGLLGVRESVRTREGPLDGAFRVTGGHLAREARSAGEPQVWVPAKISLGASELILFDGHGVVLRRVAPSILLTMTSEGDHWIAVGAVTLAQNPSLVIGPSSPVNALPNLPELAVATFKGNARSVVAFAALVDAGGDSTHLPPITDAQALTEVSKAKVLVRNVVGSPVAALFEDKRAWKTFLLTPEGRYEATMRP